MKSYEERAAAVWYERFYEHWVDLCDSWGAMDEPPPPLADIAGDDIGEDPGLIAEGHFHERFSRERGLFDPHPANQWRYEDL